MVQYAHTPWRDRAELLKVRQQFYPPAPPPAQAAAGSATTGHGNLSQQQEQIELEQQNAVSRVSMWMQRGSCPHMVESTGLITAAMLNDTHETRTRSNRPSPAIRLAYSAAFSRYVHASQGFFFLSFLPFGSLLTSAPDLAGVSPRDDLF